MDPSEAYAKQLADDPKPAKNPDDQSSVMLREADKTPTFDFLKENVKLAVAQNAEMVNEAVRMYYRSTQAGYDPDFVEATIPSWLKRGAAMKQVDQGKINRGSNSIAEGLAPAVRGVASMATMPAPGLGVAKNVMLGMGMGEGGEVLKWVFSGSADWMGASPQGQKTAGEVGEVVGASAIGFANVVRYNAIGKTLAAPADAVKSAAFAAKQKMAGDQRSAYELFTDHYGELRQNTAGMAQEKANSRVANIISRDPRHQAELEAWDRSMARAVGPKGSAAREEAEGFFSLGQKAGNKTLNALEEQQQFKTPADAADALARKDAQSGVVAGAVDRAMGKAGLPKNERALEASLETERKAAVAKIDNLEKSSSAIRARVENWKPADQAEAGGALRGQYDTERKTAQAEFNKRYESIYQMADESTARYDLNPVLKDTKAILEPLLAKVATGTAPASIRKLDALITSRARAAKKAAEAPGDLPFYMKRETLPAQPGGYSFREIHDVVKDLGRDAHAAARAGDTVQLTNLNTVAESLLTQLEKQSTPEVNQAFGKVSADYRDKFVPRFQEGVNYNLHREATTARSGRELVPNQEVWNTYLKKGDIVDRMDQFDNLFGGKLAPRNAAAYTGLGKAVEDRFAKEVLAGKFSRDKVNEFMREYQPALDRVPNVREKLSREVGENLDAIEQRKGMIADQFKEVVGSPISEAVGPVQARQFFQRAIADPAVMERALASPLGNTPEKAKAMLKEGMVLANPVTPGGGLNASELNKLLTLGQKYPGGPSSFDLLLSKALGNGMVGDKLPPAAAAHKYRLEAINEILKREAAVDPKQVRFEKTGGTDPIKEATGTTTGGMWSSIRNFQMFGDNIVGATVGRFMTNSINKSMEAAMRKAMYDPAMSEDILAMVRANKDTPINRGTYERVMGTGKASRALMKELTDHGMIRPQLARGALYGFQQINYPSEKDQEDDNKPKRVLYP